MQDFFPVHFSKKIVKVMLDAVLQYVEAVLEGKQEPDTSVGRALNDMVSAWLGFGLAGARKNTTVYIVPRSRSQITFPDHGNE